MFNRRNALEKEGILVDKAFLLRAPVVKEKLRM